MPATLPPPDRPGRYLALVLVLAKSTVPGWWSAVELGLMEAFRPLVLGDAIARMTQRNEPVATAEEVSSWDGGPDLAAAIEARWLEYVVPAGEPGDLWATPAAPGIRLTNAAQSLVTTALAVATGGERDAWTTLIRTGMGQLEVPSGSPLAVILGDGWPKLAPPVWDSRLELAAWLEARAAREVGPEPANIPAVLARLHAAVGTPWRLLGHHLTPIHAWCRLAWAMVESLPAAHPRRRILLRALRRCPLEPGLAAQVWTEIWRQHRLRPVAQRLARQFGTWSIWTDGERKRWQRRAEARNHGVKEQTWPIRATTAWLDHDASGAVLADGVRVEVRVLAVLHADGWTGIHGEGWFWSALAQRLAAPLMAAPVPGVWIGPLQRIALDHGRWGWLNRRLGLMAQLTSRLLRDPVGTIAGILTEDDDPRFQATARAVAAGLEPVVLLAMVKRILARPEAAAGLPDIVAWKDGRVALWEVKSPGDQLRDGQRDWLAWGRSHGLVVGVWEIQGKSAVQTNLFADPGTAPAVIAKPTPAKRPAGTRLPAGNATATMTLFTAPDQVPVRYLGQLAGQDLWWARTPVCPAGAFSDDGIPMPVGPPRPIVTWRAWQPRVLGTERRVGRRVVERRWHLLPPGWSIPLALVEEAHPDGGISLFATLVTRQAGWWFPGRFRFEPVLVPTNPALGKPTVLEVNAWAVYPDQAPLDPESVAEALGLGEELSQQVACIGAVAHAVMWDSEHDTITLAVPEDLGVLWVAPGLARCALGSVISQGD